MEDPDTPRNDLHQYLKLPAEILPDLKTAVDDMRDGKFKHVVVIPPKTLFGKMRLQAVKAENGDFSLEMGSPKFSTPYTSVTFDHDMWAEFSKTLDVVISVSYFLHFT